MTIQISENHLDRVLSVYRRSFPNTVPNLASIDVVDGEGEPRVVLQIKGRSEKQTDQEAANALRLMLQVDYGISVPVQLGYS